MTNQYVFVIMLLLPSALVAVELPNPKVLEVKSERDLLDAAADTTAVRCDSLPATAIARLGRLTALSSLALVDCLVDDPSWAIICKCPKLTKFSFHQRSSDKTDLSWTAKISDCSGLVELTFSSTQSPPVEFLAGCIRLPHLSSLALLWGSAVNVGSLEWTCLLECTKLESLHIFRPALDVRNVEQMKTLPNLHSLKFQGCTGLGDNWISWFLKCPSLRSLSCRALSTRDSDFSQNPLTARAAEPWVR